MITTVEAAARLGCTRPHATLLCINKVFPGAVKIGRDWMIPEMDVDTYNPKKVGRPRKGVQK